MANNKRIAKNTMFLYFRMMLIMGVTLYTSRIVLKTLGIEDFGIYNVVGGIVTMFTFLNGSLGSATSRYITFELGKKNYERLNQVFNVAFLIHLLIGVLVIVLAETIGLWFFYEKMTIPEERMSAAFWVYQISILTCFFTLTQVPYNATIIAHENMKIYAWVGIVEVICKLLVVYLLIISPFDKLVFYAALLCLVQVSIICFYRIYCSRNYKESSLKLYKDKGLYREMFGYAGSDLIGNIAALAQGQGLNLLLNVFFGPVVNAARGVAYQVQGAVTQFSSNFMTAVRPQIIKSYAQGDLKGMMKLVVDSSCFSYYLMWIISFPIMLEADYILKLWLGEYPEHTVYFLNLVLVFCLIQTLKTPRSTVFQATGHIKLTNMVVGSILCSAFPLAYLFLKIGMSPETVFWAANITMLVSEFASVFILKKYIQYSIPSYLLHVHGRCLLVSCVSAIIPFFFFDRFMEPSFIRLLLTSIMTSLFIVVTVLAIGMDKEMRRKILTLIKNKIF